MATKITKKSSIGAKRDNTKKEDVVSIKRSKDWLIPVLVGAIIVLSFGVGVLYGKMSIIEKVNLKADTTTTGAQPQAQAEVKPTISIDQVKELFNDKDNLVFGDAKRKLLFVEFSDPSCPYCHIAAGKNSELNKEVGERFILKEDGGTYVAPVPEMKKLVDEGKAGFVWVYSPGHGNGELATQALYCAKDQNKFWEVHDLLMNNTGYDLLNNTIKNDVSKSGQLADFVKSVVNAKTFETCLTSEKYVDRVQSDTALARQFGVQGTPSFFVNEQNFGGAYSFVDLQSAVDAILN